jgi:hypothetical protein
MKLNIDTYIPSDEDKPIGKKISIKSNDISRQEYFEKLKFFENYNLSYPDYDLEEITAEEFIFHLFERDTLSVLNVQPFEEIQSSEYKSWLKQKKKGVESINYNGYSCWRYNPIIFYKEEGKNAHRLLLKDDTETLNFIKGRQFALLSPITYVGRNNNAQNARYMYAFGFDLDGVGIPQLKNLFHQINKGIIPIPNIITNSGHGLHLYYLLKEPIPLYEENRKLLNKMKFGLSNVIWNFGTSTDSYTQHQGILQGFRIPGTLTKFGEIIHSYHLIGSPMHNLHDLNNFLFKYKLTTKEIEQLTGKYTYNPTSVTREEAQRRWPEWYAARVLNKKRVGKKWNVKRAVYDWWLNRLRTAKDEIQVHHRYWCILTLVIYAVKCNISREEVLNDAYSLVEKMDSYTNTEDNHFTRHDVDDAMQAYDENYNKWPIHTIEATTLFRIERNRRNKRSISEHLKRARVIRDALHEKWYENNGRKDKSAVIAEWRANNPEATKAQCCRELNLSKPTVYKWWQKDNK